jgi:predicted MFS family arabinose efflux permease
MRANGLLEGVGNFTSFAGPGISGVLIGVLGAANVMWLDAASYAISFVLVAVFVRAAREAHQATGGGVWAGIGYLRRDRLLGRACVSTLLYGFLFPVVVASYPVIAFEQFAGNPRIAGWLLMANGGGQAVGSVAVYWTVGRIHHPKLLAALGVVGLSLPLWALVPETPLAGVIAALAVSGFSNPFINVPFLGIITGRVPRALRAKVFQAIYTANQIAAPIGYAVAGPLFVAFGLHTTYALVAALAAVAMANFLTALAVPDLAPQTA